MLYENGFELRDIIPEDCRYLYEWRIHPQAMAASRNKESFSYPSHRTWFNSAIKDQRKKFYVALNNGKRVGQIRYDQKDKDRWEANVTVAPEEQGRGYGSKIVSLSAKRMFEETSATILIAEIMPQNLSSIRVFEKAGYRQVYRKTNEFGEWIVLNLLKND